MASLTESTHRILDRLEVSEMSRARALDCCLTVAFSYCAADPRSEKIETWEAWVTAMQVGSALFDSATATEGVVPCRIGIAGEVKQLPATGPTPYSHAGAWLTSVYLATICREEERLDRLMRVPVSLLRESGAVFDEYVYEWVEALQSYWDRRSSDMWSNLATAISHATPESARIADKETLLKTLYPPLELFQLYNRGEDEKFNSSLSEFLNWHRQYWTGDEARSLSSDGLVALAPLAIACMAFDNGFTIEVESDYLPKELLQFGWSGEIDT
ncbi:immunity 49 family protein [Streptomyces sp. SID7909]|uniref:immunity 49 family protein n=1 Tax=Streptomyces sp. SID7909 TaxID=2706092 RepID=UPI0013B88F32|nr:immunity 49 family protein [Streptomyces sp. SID7909]NEC08522.1 immunity 49 family protein [Streptomyces sp. SID7909]